MPALTRLARYEQQLASATSYAEWREAAQAHDRASGASGWQQRDASAQYDFRSVRQRLDALRQFRHQSDNVGLLYSLNEGVHGNLDGMGSSALYRRARFGTKQLVDDYVAEVIAALQHLASPAADDLPWAVRHDFFERASTCFGRSALMLSGSGSLFYFHVGVVKALWEQRLLPNVMCGSSGGALVASIAGTHTDDELSRMFEPGFLLAEVQRETSLWQRISVLRPGSISPDGVRDMVERLVPDMSFQEAQARTGRKINISIAPAERHQTSRLLNAIASPSVCLREALLATMAVPGILPSVMLMAKGPLGERLPYLENRRWVDGSVSDDLPTKRIARLYAVNHFIVSQTNPLVLPFLSASGGSGNGGALARYRKALRRITLEVVDANLAALEGPSQRHPTLERWLTMTRSVINQRYTGDINIFPDYRLVDPRKLMRLRTEAEVLALIRGGERATWEKLEMVRLQSAIGRTLDDIRAQHIVPGRVASAAPAATPA
ncbi:MAG: DUF3336 domain-containing protein [Gammaproteobacteria bacterium]|nr:DUF3336 domain-containing protein [Gammaproteobacteria bacterium]